MSKILLGANWRHFGVMWNLRDMGIGVNVFTEDIKGCLITIYLLPIQIFIAI